MSKPTPTPWKFSSYHAAILSRTGRAVESEICVFPVLKDWHGQGLPAAGTHATVDNQRANATLIVRAVNAFEPMREALKTAELIVPKHHRAFIRAALKLAEGD